jgi:hypothetical protein
VSKRRLLSVAVIALSGSACPEPAQDAWNADQAWNTAVALDARRIAKERYGVHLSPGLEAVPALEEGLFPSIRSDRAKANLSDRDLTYYCLGYSAVVGEGVRERCGGNWVSKPKPGTFTHPTLVVAGEEIPTFQWVSAALLHGEERAVSDGLKALRCLSEAK